MQSKGQEENACRNDDNKWIKKKKSNNKQKSLPPQPAQYKQTKQKTSTARKPLINALSADFEVNIEQLTVLWAQTCRLVSTK